MSRKFADHRIDSLSRQRSISPQGVAKQRASYDVPIGVKGIDRKKVDGETIIGSHPYVLHNNIFCAM